MFREGRVFKGFRAAAAVLLILFLAVIFCGCADNTTTEEVRLIRIHIRANSNSESDQTVKLSVRDNVNAYLTKLLDGVTDFEKAYGMLEQNITKIEQIADKTLNLYGFSYTAKAKLNNEFFPTRSYEGVVVESGYYDALILELGSAKGDNWWCVIYPPLCYTAVKGDGGKVEYKSYFAEFFSKYFGKK